MSKRNYAHIKVLLPTIEAMVAEGMTQREIAEHFGFKDTITVLWHIRQPHSKLLILSRTQSGWQ